MAAFQFPINPIIGQVFTPIPGVSYKYDGTGWVPFTAQAITAAQAQVVAAQEVTAHNASTSAHLVATGLLWKGSNKFVSTAAPSAGDGVNGDLWFQTEP